MRRNRVRIRSVALAGLLLAAVAVVGIACGGATSTSGAASSVDVSLGDNFFKPNQFTFKAGQEVTFRISNGGQLPHNMRIDGPDGQFTTPDDTLSNPEMILGGASGVLTWIAPGAGTYKFRCDFHPESNGTITIQ